MKPVILLTGKNGQVGGELLRHLPQLGEVIAPGREQLDLSKPDDIRRTILDVRPQLIINAAAYTAVDKAETDPAMAQAINEKAPGLMAVEAKKIGATLLHYSTDYIFDGTKRVPYDEADSANPINIYGKTKFAGEQAIRSSGVPHLIFRTAWVYATRGRNFLLTMLRLATEREELRIVSDQVGAPTCAADLAAATCRILAGISERNRAKFVFSEVGGTYHMSAAGQTTWYGFAQTIFKEAEAARTQFRMARRGDQGTQLDGSTCDPRLHRGVSFTHPPPVVFSSLKFPIKSGVWHNIARLAISVATLLLFRLCRN